jgi:mevalonate kinase
MAVNGSIRRPGFASPRESCSHSNLEVKADPRPAVTVQQRSTSQSTQTPEPSPVDAARTQLASKMPSAVLSSTDTKPALKRKQSSPVSAPGKVSVYGEHAVVHGKVHLTRY